MRSDDGHQRRKQLGGQSQRLVPRPIAGVTVLTAYGDSHHEVVVEFTMTEPT